MADQAGAAEVAFFPTFQGFRAATNREVEATGSESGGRFSRAFGGAVAGVASTIAALGIGNAIRSQFQQGIQGASELQQSTGAVEAVFKGQADQIKALASQAKSSLGITKNEYQELGTVIGSQLKNGGTAMEELAPKTAALISTGADLSAMFGGSTKEAVEALSSALKGERDPIERYGVSLNQAKIDAEAAALGFEKVGGSFDGQAQQAATLSLITKQTADAQGAAAREAGSYASQQARLSATFQEGRATLANVFLPAVTAVTAALADKLPGAIVVAEGAAKKLVAGLSGVSAILFAGDYRSEFGEAFGFAEDAPIVDVLFRIREGILGVKSLLLDGDFTSNFRTAFNVEEDAPVVGFLLTLRENVASAFASIRSAITTGDFSALSGVFESVMAVARPAAPILLEVGSAVGSMSGEIGNLVGSALPLLTPALQGAASVMQFLADNTGILTAAIVGVTGVILIAKAAQVAKNIADALAVPSAFAQAGANLTLASAIRAQTAATGASTVATRASAGANLAAAAGMVRTGIAAVASRVGMLAGAAATGVATAAQWAWNAALSANPIGIIIVAIAALVAALVFFFTQTELGRTIWASFMTFLQEAWANIVAVAQVVWQAIVTAVQVAWSLVVLYVQTYIAVVQAIIGAVLGFIVGVWNAAWNGIVAVITFVWNLIVAYVTTYINVVLAIVTAVIGFVSAVWQAGWDLVSTVVQAVWNFIVSFVTAYINTMLAIISAVISTVQAVWSAGWAAVSAVVQAVWAFVVSTIQNAVNIVSSIVSTLVRIFTDAWNGAAQAVSAGVETVLGYFRDLPGNVMSALGNVGSMLYDSGQAIIGGFIDGISSMIGAVGDAVGGVLDFASGFFPNSPAKRGPLSGDGWRRISRSGKAVVRAFNDGMDSEPIMSLDRLGTAASSRTFRAAAADVALSTTPTGLTATAKNGDEWTVVEVTNKTGARLDDLIDIRVRKTTAADGRRAEALGRRR